ncbi:type III restriction-modification system endonuclease [Gallibacterium genomosp. 1]|uniref:Restriction endonuclease subunit R n=1 Tax=Gallibacterium genomosp. 1 TaxID=155515 RepID=A0AB36DXH6_9PAST|nr:DEAD/DEAH box helicase family protein [Gallibacterium genomosp. 1]OBW99795.1 restriction endonuclease subunit R [Gallibacterium genomosp. 1]OBX02244.1 restriction endonuclease subunit R [Gallibacterium genomosp. 1]
MKLKFKIQAYQSEAVKAVVDCFAHQPQYGETNFHYRMDLGKKKRAGNSQLAMNFNDNNNSAAYRNADIEILPEQLLDNVQNVQQRQNLPVSEKLVKNKIAPINLDIEMETGTGKTYCYIKTMFELNRRYGWCKFIIVVPSIAIREGVKKTLEITADHFQETYGKKAKFFVYDSKQLHHLESFSSDAGINVMVINVQAFNATGKDNRRIYEELDDFQSRRPIEVISANRPILILDEPQKMEGDKTLKSLEQFKALMVLRYSATHKTTYNKIFRLDALDAYNQKLVKKIAVRGISVKGLAGTAGYLYLEKIEISPKKPPEAVIEFEQKNASGNIKRICRKFKKGDNLFDLSGGLEQYRTGFVVSDINANIDSVSFLNGMELKTGEAIGDINETVLRRIQIREAIAAHFEKERQLFVRGIKVLSLFFIDEVAKYRDYDQPDEKGEYARIFEEEYKACLNELPWLELGDYGDYLKGISSEKTHNGYFSIDKNKRLIDPKVKKNNGNEADDVDAYDLILKDKERLLSFEEPVRFIFSHSALREGWDNPNVFVICTLKHSDNTISRRQEVGRGLRLAVNQTGERMDNPATVYDINVLTVVANESYQDFVKGLQKDISESLSARPQKAEIAYFTGKTIENVQGEKIKVDERTAKKIYQYLVKNDYVDENDQITEQYHSAKKAGNLASLPEDLQPYAPSIRHLIDNLYNAEALSALVDDDRAPKLNALNENFNKQAFKALWQRINHKAVYTVHFDSNELVEKAIGALNSLHVAPLQYRVEKGEQKAQIAYEDLQGGRSFQLKESTPQESYHSAYSAVRYDLIGKITEGTQLTRQTVAKMLMGMKKIALAKFAINPEQFITEAIRLINEQKATTIIEHLAYDTIEEKFDPSIFTLGQNASKLQNALATPRHHIYDYVVTDSKIEREFAQHLETSAEVVVYAKLPRGFFIPTPVGDYNPDWAIAFKEGTVKHVYFVAETKGSMSSMDLRTIEQSKIECAKKFFAEMNRRFTPEKVQYDVVESFEKLVEIVQ